MAVVCRGITDDLLFLLVFGLLLNCLEAACIPLEKERQSLLFLRIPSSPQSPSSMSLLAPSARPPARGALSCPCRCPTGRMEASGFVLPVPQGPSVQRRNRRTRGDARCPRCPWGRRVHTGQAPGCSGRCQSRGMLLAGPRLGPFLCPHLVTWSRASRRCKRESVTGQGLWVAPPALGSVTVPVLPLTPPSRRLPRMECPLSLPATAENRRAAGLGLGRPAKVSVLILVRVAREERKMTFANPKSRRVGNRTR